MVEQQDQQSPAPVEDSPFGWYSLQVFTGKEQKIKETILEESVRQGLADLIRTIHIPTEKKVELRGGKRKIKEVTLFPGYMFVEMNPTLAAKHFLLETQHVLSFVGNTLNPLPLPEEDVVRIIGRAAADDEPTLDHNYSVGDSVKVIDGPFNDFTGILQEISEEKKRLKVMVSIFGRSTPVELNFTQVEPIE